MRANRLALSGTRHLPGPSNPGNLGGRGRGPPPRIPGEGLPPGFPFPIPGDRDLIGSKTRLASWASHPETRGAQVVVAPREDGMLQVEPAVLRRLAGRPEAALSRKTASEARRPNRVSLTEGSRPPRTLLVLPRRTSRTSALRQASGRPRWWVPRRRASPALQLLLSVTDGIWNVLKVVHVEAPNTLLHCWRYRQIRCSSVSICSGVRL